MERGVTAAITVLCLAVLVLSALLVFGPGPNELQCWDTPRLLVCRR